MKKMKQYGKGGFELGAFELQDRCLARRVTRANVNQWVVYFNPHIYIVNFKSCEFFHVVRKMLVRPWTKGIYLALQHLAK